MKNSEQRIKQHLEALAQFTATPGAGTTRLSYSDEDKQARAYLKSQIRSLGLQVSEDAIGNIYGRLAGVDNTLPPVMVGSHFDSVPHGGMFDGPAGVVTALEVASRFYLEKYRPHCPVDIVALVEEEGTSFGAGLLASRTLVGQVSASDMQQLHDRNGVSAYERMAQAGFNADDIPNMVRKPGDIKAFIELHIEQGPVLEAEQLDLGLVDVVVGISQLEITIEGKAGHAGTTPMAGRVDALRCAAQLVEEVAQLAEQAGDGAVATVGKLAVYPNGANVIPSKVTMSVDIRAKNAALIEQIIQGIQQKLHQIQQQRFTTTLTERIRVAPQQLDPKIHQCLAQESERLGYRFKTMPSGAGHDAMIFASIAPVGLVFVPSRHGLSHHPDEWTDYAQIEKGVDVVYATIKALTKAE